MNIAVITPAYNAENTVSRAMESVAGQVFLPDCSITHYLVDDASTDGTLNAMLRLAQRLPLNVPRKHSYSARVIHLTENGGPAKARNAALAEIGKENFDAVAFLDSDDIWMPHHLKKSLDLLFRYGRAQCCAPVFMFDNGEQAEPYGIPVYQEPTPKNVYKRNSIYISSVVAKPEHLAGQFDDRLDGIEDWDYWLSMMRNGCVFERHGWNTVIYTVKVNGMASHVNAEKLAILLAKHDILRKY